MKVKFALLFITLLSISCNKDKNLPKPAEAVVGYYNVIIKNMANNISRTGNVAIGEVDDNTVQITFINGFNGITVPIYANVKNNSSKKGKVDIELQARNVAGQGSVIYTGNGFYVNNSIQITLVEYWNSDPEASILVGSK